MRRLLHDEQLARVVLAGFLHDLPHQLTLIRQGLDRHDADALRIQAHTLRGASATVSAYRLQEIASAMEHTLSAGDLDGCAVLYGDARDAFDDFRMAVRDGGWV